MFEKDYSETHLYESLFTIDFLTRFGYYDAITKDEKILSYAKSDSLLVDIFNMDSLADFIQEDEYNFRNKFFSNGAKDREDTEPISFSIPKNLTARREYKMPNIFTYLQLAYYISDNKDKFIDVFKKNQHSTSKYFNQLGYTYTVTQEIKEGHLSDDNNILHMDLTNFYHSLYTHTIPWMILGRNESKKNRKQGFSNELDQLIQSEQFGETYGIPVGNLLSRIISELYMCYFDSKIEEAFTNEIRFTRYVDDFQYTFTNESQKDAFIQRFRFLCREYRLNINEYKTTVENFPYLTTLNKNSIFHYFDEMMRENSISEKMLKREISTFIDLCLHEESQGNKGAIKSCFSVLGNFLEKCVKENKLTKKSINGLFSFDNTLTGFNLFDKLLSLSLHDSKLSNLFIRFSKKLIELGLKKDSLQFLVERYFFKNRLHVRTKIIFYKENDYNQETYQILLYLVFFNVHKFFTRDELLGFIDDKFDDYTICLSVILYLKSYKMGVFPLLYRINSLLDEVNNYYNQGIEVMAQKHWLVKYFFYDLVQEDIINSKKINTYNHKRLHLRNYKGGGHMGLLNYKYALKSSNKFKTNSFFVYLLENRIHLVSFGKDNAFEYMR